MSLFPAREVGAKGGGWEGRWVGRGMREMDGRSDEGDGWKG